MGRNLTEDLVQAQFESWPELFAKFKALSAQYGGMPVDSLVSAFQTATGSFGRHMTLNPFIQNRRVKELSSLPKNYTKDSVARMLTAPEENERGLREVEHGLEYTAYPMFHLRKVYSDLLTYHSYIAPQFLEKDEGEQPGFWREYRLAEKLRQELDPKTTAHELAGRALQEGKVFVHPRISADKSHNKINYAFLQALPSDWVKIVGFNNKSKYTVAFDLMYFAKAGRDPYQYGDLFTPYLDLFQQVVTPRKAPGSRAIYASGAAVDLEGFKAAERQARGKLAGEPELYYQNGRWCYWVTLPAEEVFPFEIDDTNRNVAPPFTGLFLSMLQLATYEQVQEQIVQNPLISLVTGEIPYRKEKEATKDDQYMLSNTGREFFEWLWYQMLAENNTSGIGLFMAPVENMKLHTLSEAPNAMDISSTGYAYTMAKAGLSGIVPTTDDPKAGLAQISLSIEAKFAQGIYRCYERMMKVILEGLNLRHLWKFVMFGDLATDQKTEESARQGMTLGLLPDTVIYNALHDRSLFDDLALSAAVEGSGVLDLRRPLRTSYSAAGETDDGGLSPEAKHQLNKGGRPRSDGEVTSEGQEDDIDNIGE